MNLTVRIGNIAEQVRGVTYSKEDLSPEPCEGYLPVLRAGNLADGQLVLDDLVYVLADRISAKQLLRKGDVVVATSSGSLDVVGKAAPVREPTIASFGAFCKVLRPGADVDPAYFAFFFQSPAYRRRVSALAAGVNINNLRNEHLDDLELPAPPLAEQRRIAALLDEADALRRKRRESLALLDDLVHSVFVQIVGEGSPHHPSWPVRRVEDLAARTPSAMRTGPFGSALLHSEFVDDGIAVLGIDNAVQNRFAWGERRFITPEKHDELRRYTVFPNDVIITIMGTTGRSAVVPAEVPTAITTKHLATITPNTLLVRPEFLSNAIHRDSGVLRQIGNKNRGAIMDGLNLGIIRELEIRVPPLETQQTFERALGEIRSLEEQLRAGLDQAQQLFDSLLHRAFSGEL